MGIRGKIVVPYLGLFLVLFGAAGWVAVDGVTGAVETRLRQEIHDLARVVANAGFRPTGNFLAKVRDAFGAEVVLTDDAGRFLEGTLPAATWPDDTRPTEQARAVRTTARGSNVDGEDYVAAAAPLLYGGKPSGQHLILLTPAERIREEKWRAAAPLIAGGALGLVLAFLIGYAIARRIAQPLTELAAQTQAIARGDAAGLRVPATGDEIQQLGADFERLLQALARHQADLRRAERTTALGTLAAAIAHEIRNPLTAMKLTLQLLERDERDAERRQGFAVVLQEVERLRLLVEEMLDLGGPARLERTPADLNAIVREALALLARQSEHRGVRLAAELGALPPLALDASRIKQVVLNLVLNALEATPRGADVTVRTTAAPADGGRVRLEVTDAGPGIAPAARARLFEPFSTTKPGGVGLGLSISRRVVLEHGGQIGFDAPSTGGTRFWIELPIHAPAPVDAPK